MKANPFVTSGYAGPAYFCDREAETASVIRDVEGRMNKVMISPRRMGKTGLIQHCFHDQRLRDGYNCFFVDIYSTLNLTDFVARLGNRICESLKPKGRQAVELFCRIVRSLEFRMGFDAQGMLEASFGLGDVKNPNHTLEEIFRYLDEADKPCVVAIDEFQQIAKYPEANTEALLRTYVQHARNAVFIFAGSKRHMLQNMFFSASKPFYNSASVLNLKAIPLASYVPFVCRLFREAGKSVAPAEVEYVYDLFEGHTWYMQNVFYMAFFATNGTCDRSIVEDAIRQKVEDNGEIYKALLYGVPEKQQRLLKAIAFEGKAEKIQSGDFVRRYGLQSPSAAQSAAKRLLDNDLITVENGTYRLDDRFFSLWLRKTFKP